MCYLQALGPLPLFCPACPSRLARSNLALSEVRGPADSRPTTTYYRSNTTAPCKPVIQRRETQQKNLPQMLQDDRQHLQGTTSDLSGLSW